MQQRDSMLRIMNNNYMKHQNYLLLIILFILLGGCNSISSEKSDNKKATTQTKNNVVQSAKKNTIPLVLVKEKSLPPINPKIQDLLDNTEVLQVPLAYCYEDTFNINTVENVEPLSDEMQDLLSVEKINDWITDFSGILWLSCQLNLSENYRTLVFSIFTGGEGKNVLVNYTNDFKFIDSEHITYEDYVEGYYGAKSLIENDKIILYESSYTDYPKKDTTIFSINKSGIIDTLNNH